MNFTKYQHITEAVSSDGRTITCTYFNHPHFSHECDLSSVLHYVFLKYTQERAYTAGYLLRQAIFTFLDFTAHYNEKNSPLLHIDSISKINAEVFSFYQSFLLKRNHKITQAEKLKTALITIAQQDDHLSIVQLPPIQTQKWKKTEPLYEETLAELVNSLKTHVDKLYIKIKFRIDVEKVDEYNYDEVMIDAFPSYDKANIFCWYQDKKINNKKITSQALAAKLSLSTDDELFQLTSDPDILKKFRELYSKESALHLLSEPRNPFLSTGIRNWIPSYSRSMKSLLTNGYPFDIPLGDIEEKFNHLTIINIGDCKNIIKLIMHRHLRCINQTKVKLLPWDDFLSLYYPNLIDMAAITIFLMLQSGWNKETVLALDGDNFEHILTGVLNKKQAMIFSEKHRGQGKGKPYFDPKEFIAPSDKTNKYSIYNLILLAQELSRPLVDYPFDYIPVSHDNESLNPLFLCIRYYADWVNKGGRHTSIVNNKAFMTGIKHFLVAYPLKEKGKQLKSAEDLTKRLRPTWVKFHRKSHPLSIIALQQGHTDKNTTDIYYDSSGSAMQERRERLRSELENVIDLLRQRKFSGLLCHRDKEQSTNKSLRIFSIPGYEKALWGCANQLTPDWPGFEQHIRFGQKCYSLENCMFCSQVYIFEDSLPYLIERLSHIEERLDLYSESGFSSSLASEKNVIEYILDEWGDETALKTAVRYQRRNAPLLPRDLSALMVIFEDGDVNETM